MLLQTQRSCLLGCAVTYSCWEIDQESRHNLLKKKNRNESLILGVVGLFV
jgi:hypothetical protein